MNIKIKLILFHIFFLISSVKLSAQISKKPTAVDTLRKQQDSLASQKDVIDILHQLFRNKNNPKPVSANKRFIFSIVPSIGYTLSTGFAASLTGNVAFYAEPKKHENLSSINSNLSYNQHNQITFRINSNIWTKDDDFNFVGDWRLYKFPENTYGLGSLSSLNDLTPIKYDFLRFYETVLKKLKKNFYGGLGYDLDYHYNITANGTPSQSLNDYTLYGKTTSSISSGVTFNLLYDNRVNSINARNGAYANIIFRPNLKLLGSDNNWQSLTIDLRKYVPITPGGKSIIAFWTLETFTLNGHAPYFDLPSTAWDTNGNTGRGYPQGRFRGTNMLYAEAAYRFDISNNGLFGGVLFLNGQSFADYPVATFQRVLPGYGPGLRIKFNKRSNTNLCIDYGIGVGNSHGVFVNLGEVF